MTVARSASPDVIDLSAVWRRVRGSLWWLIPIAVLVSAATHFLLSTMAPRFQSEVQLAISARGQPNPFADPARDQSGSDVAVRMDKEAINTHVGALKSAALGEQVATELRLAERPEFNSAAGAVDAWTGFWQSWGFGAPRASETDMDRVLTNYFRQLDVYSPKESRTINVRFTSVDPDLAAAIANRLVEQYRTEMSAKVLDETGHLVKSLEPEVKKLADDVAAAEREAQQFRGQANIFSGGAQATGLNEQQLGELSAELTRTKAVRSDAEARLASARDLAQAGAADTLPDVQKSALIQNLIQSRVRVERQIAELSATLLPGHPRMRQLSADLAGLKRQIAAETKKIVDGIGKELTVARLREAALAKSIDEVKRQILRQSPDEVKLRQLEAAAKTKRLELERLQAQFETNRTRLASQAIPVETQIIAPARPSASVVFPKKTPLSVAAGLAALFAGLGVVFTRAIVAGARAALPADGKVEATFDPVFERKSEPVLASVARADEASRSGDRASEEAPKVIQDAVVPVAAVQNADASVGSIADLAAKIGSRVRGESGLRIVVAHGAADGTAAQEAIDLAKALAKLGQAVMLIDWAAPNDAGCCRLLKLPEAPGVRDILAGSASFDDCVRAIGGEGVHVLAGGASPFDGDRDRLNIVLDALDEAYAFIVVTGNHGAVRDLFQAVEGRFDVAVTVGAGSVSANRYLGFDVVDMELYRLDEPPAGSQVLPAGRMRKALGVGRREPVVA